MQELMILARAAHFASVVSLGGVFSFLVFVAEPALRNAAPPDAAAFRRRLRLLATASVVVALMSGLLWLVLEAHSMSGRSFAEVFSQGIAATVLTRTNFGRIWQLRFVLAMLLAGLLLIIGDRTRDHRAADALRWTALLLSAAMLAALAWAGHAGATQGSQGRVHVVSDALHLLAAGAWLGGLAPLALLLARGAADPAWLGMGRDATRRFSVLGIASVGTLLVTGIVNTWFLAGSIPALLGTGYGRLLLMKIALFGAMVALAAINRQRLTPQLLASPSPALQRLRRNAIIETVLGLAILLIVGALGTEPPAAHMQPDWPLPFRLHLDVFPRTAALDREAALHGVMVALGVAALVLAAWRWRGRWLAAAVGLGIILGFGRVPLSWILEDAYPTSFYRSPVPYDAPSIARGAARYADQCSQCHGADGRGDGSAGRDLPVKPADLTAPHLFAHSEGDLFWWISHGRNNGAMPAFAEILSEDERWDLINFIRARAAAVQGDTLLPLVTPAPAPPAPDFAFEQAGREETLRRASERGPVLLILYRLPGSLARLEALDGAKDRLQRAGLRLLAVPLDAESADRSASLPDFTASTGPETIAAYALFAGLGAGEACEFLIDGAGFLRARWKAGTTIGLAPPQELLAQLGRLAKAPQAREARHVHEH